MKKIILLLFIQLFTLKLISQVVFCPPGAEWNYNYSNFWTQQATEQIKIVYVGDTIVGNDTLKIINHTKFFTQCATRNCTPTYIKQKGDTIFMKNNCTNGIWQILYNFASQTGQNWYNTLQIKGTPTITANYTISILSTSTVQINGFILKELTAQYTYGWLSYLITEPPVKITERLGCSRYLFNFYNKTSTDCDFFVRNLCYRDSTFGIKQFTALPCDYSNPLGLNEKNEFSNKLLIYPNPGIDHIQIQGDISNQLYNLKITNLLGRELKKQSVLHNEKVDIRDFHKGIYFLSLFSEEGLLIHQTKFIKE